MPENNDWKPDWDREGPKAIEYCYPDKSFCVTVESNGIIFVTKDDWLSKYSMAIHRDFDFKDRYLKYNIDTQSLDFIKNIDLIFEGDILLHVPTYNYLKKVQVAIFEPDNPIIPGEDDSNSSIHKPDPTKDPGNWIGLLDVLFTIAGMFTEVMWVVFCAPIIAVVGASYTVYSAAKGIYSAQQNRAYLLAETFYAEVFSEVEYAFYKKESDELPPYVLGYTSVTSNLINADYERYVPMLPILLPQQTSTARGIASPDAWTIMYDNFFSQSVNDIDDCLEQLKKIWEETSNTVIEDFNKKQKSSGFSPKDFKEKLRSRRKENGEVITLTKKELFVSIFCNKYAKLKKELTGLDRDAFLPFVKSKKNDNLLYISYLNAYDN